MEIVYHRNEYESIYLIYASLVILSMALNVSEAWLIGFDVPTQRYSTLDTTPQIMDYYNQLNDFGKKEATKYLEELTHFSKYTDNNFANEENF